MKGTEELAKTVPAAVFGNAANAGSAEAAQDAADAFAASPAFGIEDWLRTGQAPPAAELRAAGLDRWRLPQHGGIDARWQLQMARDVFVRLYGFSVPCAEAVEAIKAIGQPVLEVGAGTGYWSALLAAAGLDVVATDAAEPGAINGYRFTTGRCHQVLQHTARDALLAYPRRTVLCSWPCYREPWLSQAIRIMRPGQHLVLIGEGAGGCTGTECLFHQLAADFDEVAHVAIPQWPGLNDRLTVHRKRKLALPVGRLP